MRIITKTLYEYLSKKISFKKKKSKSINKIVPSIDSKIYHDKVTIFESRAIEACLSKS